MIKFKRLSSIAALMLWDSFCVFISLYIGFTLRYTSNSFNNPMNIPPAYYCNFPYYVLVFTLLMFGLNFLFRCYNSVLKRVNFNEAFRQLCSSWIGFALFYLIDLLFTTIGVFPESKMLEIGILLIMTSFMFLFMMLGRSCIKLVYAIRARFSHISGYSVQKRVVIFGAGEAGEFLVSKL